MPISNFTTSSKSTFTSTNQRNDVHPPQPRPQWPPGQRRRPRYLSIAGAYGQQNTREEKLAFLDHAHSIGQRFWDTADIYFDSEAIIGEWFKRSGKRGDIFLATKFGLSYDASMQQSIRSDPEYVRMACERSLEKLGVETIDLYYCHRVDGVTPIEKTVEAMVQLKR